MSDNEIVVIVGGNFANKGAQLMVSVAIEIVKSFESNVTPIVVDSFPNIERNAEYEGTVVLNLPFYLNFAYCMTKGMKFTAALLMRTAWQFLSSAIRGRLFGDVKSGILVLKSIKKAVYIVDISGYGYNSNSGLMNYIQLSFSHLASTKSVPYIYFSQSFGPFDGKESLLNSQIKTAIHSAAYIFCREHLSMKALASLSDEYSGGYWPDIALLYGKEVSIPRKLESLGLDLNTVKGSVVLIPNARLYGKFSKNRTNNLYSTLISHLLRLGHRVTILKHSSDDLTAVRNIKYEFLKKVCVLEMDYDLEVIDNIIASSKFVISGRYHGLVVSLKNSVPCMAIGWAHKYDELLGIYGIESNNFDLSKPVDSDEVCSQLEYAIGGCSSLASSIKVTNSKLLYKYPLSKFVSLCHSDCNE